eukprot:TRINITY_DN48252_c0_g1_i1.p1 TRINITY_DN48252_c0_g1~~TRINITY_DN48252_c0_g1_i1.p1  ORF type:complete len:515 (-),score=62.48 TRINITY_DN48252_c0_g1_i1:477-2021(-)
MSRSASRNGTSSADPRLYPSPAPATSATAPPRPHLAIPTNYPQPGRPSHPSPAPSTPSTTAPSHPPRPASAPPQNANTEVLPPGFEVLIQLDAAIFEKINPDATPPLNFHGVPALPPPQPTAPLLVVQGPLAPDPQSSQMLYYAFINTRSFNFPLMPSTTCRRIGPKSFRIKVDHRRFIINLAPSTNPKMVQGFIALLQWFCTWKDVEGSHTPVRMDDSVSNASSTSPTSSQKGTVFDSLGDKGVQKIEKIAEFMNTKTQSVLEKHHVAAASARDRGKAKDLSLGGKVTVGALNATQKVFSTTAKVTGAATDKIASTLGRSVTRTVTRPLANAPTGSKRRRFYEQLASGCLAAGRIFVTGDRQVRMYINNTADSAALVTGARYGAEAEHMCRQFGHIVVDGFRIYKFPSDLGYKSLMQSGIEEEFRRKGEAPSPPPPPTYADEPADDSLVNPSRNDSAQRWSPQPPVSNPVSYPSSSSSLPSVVETPTTAPQPRFEEPVMHIPFQDLSVNLPKK